jgi:hypothetical protein
LKTESLEIVPIFPEGKAWIGVSDLKKKNQRNQKIFVTFVKRMIRHPKSYNGGKLYKMYGGYDISLVEFKSIVPPEYGSPACLPTPSFQDEGVKGLIAGYGWYYRQAKEGKRQICLTDNYGRNKYHMCAKSGSGPNVCKTTLPPSSAECQDFFKYVNHTYPDEYEEIQLVNETGNVDFCFRTSSPKTGSKGWCSVSKSFYGLKGVVEKGWGFCSKDCYLGEYNSVEDSNILRKTNDVDILPHDLCDMFVNASAKEGPFTVHPQVICVGMLMPWKSQVWKKQGKY